VSSFVRRRKWIRTCQQIGGDPEEITVHSNLEYQPKISHMFSQSDLFDELELN